MVDLDGDGHVSREEFRDAMAALAAGTQGMARPDDRICDELFEEIDADASGQLSYEVRHSPVTAATCTCCTYAHHVHLHVHVLTAACTSQGEMTLCACTNGHLPYDTLTCTPLPLHSPVPSMHAFVRGRSF